MSRIQNLKDQFPNYNWTIFDSIKVIDPSGKNTYCDLVFKHLKNRVKEINKSFARDTKDWLFKTGLDKEKIESLTDFELSQIRIFFENYITSSDLESLLKFEKLRKSGRISSVDLTKINTLDDLSNFISVAELKDLERTLEKQVVKLFEDDEWICLRPLTYESSIKYGSNTKWCTTYHDPDHFYRYSDRGILIYTINKKTGYKVATFFSLNTSEPELSFWNQVDSRIDSLQTSLPDFILKRIIEETKTSFFTNAELSPFEKVAQQIETKSSEEPVAIEINHINNIGTYSTTLTVTPDWSIDDITII